MKRTTTSLLALLVLTTLAACQPDEPRRTPRGTKAGSGEAAGQGGVSSAQPVRYQIFQREAAEDAPPRTTLHMLVDAQASRDELRVTFQKIVDDYTAEHDSVVAVRLVGYVARSGVAGDRRADLVPLAWGEWLPPSGWYEASRDDRDEVHRLYFYHGSPPPWR